MDGELVSASPSSNEGSNKNVATLKSYTDTFNELFPYYLSIGMTEEQYWDKDSRLVIFYRKSDEMLREKHSFEAWLQGRYFYDALLCASPILHAFAKKGAKPLPYADSPYPVTKAMAKKSEEDKEKAKFDKNKSVMEMFMLKFNKQFEEKG